jgi:FKBP-type peptidyl-prolyl cis-trans isomerase SlyD
MMFTFAAGLIALLFNLEARVQESPAQKTNISDEELTVVSQTRQQKVKEDKMIKNGSVVSFEYTISDENGKFIESNRGKEPVTYTHGQQQIIPGLEKKLSGMKINEEKNVRLPPEEAFGPVDAKGFQEVPKDNFPAEDLKVGTTVQVRGRQGEDLDLRVHEIKEESVVLDLNHPLAGKTLNFGVKVLDIQPGESE